MPEIFEHERFSTTVANAVVSRSSSTTRCRLGERLASEGYTRDLLLLHSGGGVMTPGASRILPRAWPDRALPPAPSPAATSPACAAFPTRSASTWAAPSTDVSLAYEGQSRITKDWYIEFGYPIRFPSIEVLTIGAGGGSLAWTDAAGSLRTARSRPAPIRARPATATAIAQPTNTDANVALGRLGTSLAGGKVTLDAALPNRRSQEALPSLSAWTCTRRRTPIMKVANANMANAVRLISISRGYDPRDFALVAFGGAGALHGAAVARNFRSPS